MKGRNKEKGKGRRENGEKERAMLVEEVEYVGAKGPKDKNK